MTYNANSVIYVTLHKFLASHVNLWTIWPQPMDHKLDAYHSFKTLTNLYLHNSPGQCSSQCKV